LLVLAACQPQAETSTEPGPAGEASADTLPEGDGTRENPYVGRGIVQELGDGELVIDHEMIPGWMPAMSMTFPVTDEVSLEGLAVGDPVLFSVELAGPVGYQIVEGAKVD
jgi:hypothetical protein